VRVADIEAERGLAVGPGRYHQAPAAGPDHGARNAPARSRPWYSSGSGGMVTQTSSVSRATMPSTSAAANALVSQPARYCSAAEPGAGRLPFRWEPLPPLQRGAGALERASH
jgi:hypothetical protein